MDKGSESTSEVGGLVLCTVPESRRVEPDEEEDAVVSRMYSITSQVCNVASGANETLRLAVRKVSIGVGLADARSRLT